jgi:hypothetical protein
LREVAFDVCTPSLSGSAIVERASYLGWLEIAFDVCFCEIVIDGTAGLWDNS